MRRHYFKTADEAIEALEASGFVWDGYDPTFPWRSPDEKTVALIRFDEDRKAYTYLKVQA